MTERRAARPTSAKRAKTDREILRAAGQVFTAKGLDAARIEEIAERAGVSPGTVYGHFRNKEGLAIAYLNLAYDLFEARLTEARKHASPLDRVRAAGDAYIEHVIAHPAASRLVATWATYPTAEQRRLVAHLDRRAVAWLIDVAADLRAAMEVGELPSESVQDAMLFLWAAWHGMGALVTRTDSLAVPPDAARRALDLGRSLLLARLDPHRV